MVNMSKLLIVGLGILLLAACEKTPIEQAGIVVLRVGKKLLDGTLLYDFPLIENQHVITKLSNYA